jgi:hypothetical protein
MSRVLLADIDRQRGDRRRQCLRCGVAVLIEHGGAVGRGLVEAEVKAGAAGDRVA